MLAFNDVQSRPNVRFAPEAAVREELLTYPRDTIICATAPEMREGLRREAAIMS